LPGRLDEQCHQFTAQSLPSMSGLCPDVEHDSKQTVTMSPTRQPMHIGRR
jgi:hypothetical protein